MFEIKLSYHWKLNYDQSLMVISTKNNINRLFTVNPYSFESGVQCRL